MYRPTALTLHLRRNTAHLVTVCSCAWFRWNRKSTTSTVRIYVVRQPPTEMRRMWRARRGINPGTFAIITTHLLLHDISTTQLQYPNNEGMVPSTSSKNSSVTLSHRKIAIQNHAGVLIATFPRGRHRHRPYLSLRIGSTNAMRPVTYNAEIMSSKRTRPATRKTTSADGETGCIAKNDAF